jgi:uncharacterized protein YndB with AHSA1/START domain
MIRVEVEKMIDRPIEDVFDRLVNIDGYPRWLPPSQVFLSCRQTSEGSVDVGTTFVDKTRIGTYRGEVTDFQRPIRVNFRMKLDWLGMSVMESRPRYRLEAVDGRTQVHHIAVGQLYGPFKLLRPYVAIRAENERERTLAALKQSLEAPAP